MCIERDEIDESKGNVTLKPDKQDVVILPEEKKGSLRRDILDDDDDFFVRRARQFSAHMRMSSCHDEALSYICETK